MKEFSNVMANCMGQISQLSYGEITELIVLLNKEREARDAKRLKEKINAAIKTINDLSKDFEYLDGEDDAEIYLSDIIEGLKKLLAYTW